MGTDPSTFPTYSDLIYPVLRAVATLGGSANASEITTQVATDLDLSDEALAVTYENKTKTILPDRIAWARSYAKLGGALDSPKRSLFLLTPVGRQILALPEDQAREQTKEMDRQVRAERRTRPQPKPSPIDEADDDVADEVGDDDWKTTLLQRLHRLTPEGFEEFVMYFLRAYGLELTRIGGSGDEGIDGIGTAPLSDVLSSRVAVQAKRYDPNGAALGREVVALFQRDAAAAGAERAVLVTLGRFSGPARKAAIVARPTVDLIDGDRLCELAQREGIGVHSRPHVDETWFDRFD